MQKIFLITYSILLLSLASLSAQVTFTPTSPSVSCATDTFCIDVQASSFDSIISLQFAMEWDETQLSFIEAITTLPPIVTPLQDSVANGQFWFSWIDLSFATLSLPDNSTIWKLCFEPINGGSSDITIGPVPVAPFILEVNGFENGQPGPLPYALNSGTATVSDIENPLISCPNDTTVYNPGALNVGNIAPLTTTDNCGIDTTFYQLSGASSSQGANDASNEVFQLGTTTVTYTTEDGAGNSATCSFEVTVLDTTTMSSDLLEFIPVVNFDCDNNTIEVEVQVINFDSISSFAHAVRWDTTQLQYTGATQGDILTNLPQLADNTVYTTFTFLSPPFYQSLPDNSVIYTLSFTPIGTPTLPFVSFENLNANQIILVNDNNGILTQGVDYVFQPEVFNFVDNTAPVITNCPTDQSISASTTQCGNTYSWTSPSVSDACATVSVDSTHASGDFFPVGATTVTYTATDEAGNTATCSFVVTVVDDIDPSITCPADISLATDSGRCDAMVDVPAPTSSDNCGIETTTYTIGGTSTTLPANATMFTETFPVGITMVTYTVTDSTGLTATCDFTVTVSDGFPPTIACPVDTSLMISGQTNIVVGNIGATASDDCGTPVVTYSLSGVTTTPGPNTDDASGTTFEAGVTTVTYYATDPNGLVDSCSFNVNVILNQSLSITCPTPNVPAQDADAPDCGDNVFGIDVIINSDLGNIGSITYTLSGATTGADTISASGVFFNVGTTNVTYTVEDIFGNMEMCSFDVVVVDNINPNIVCPTVDAFPTDAGVCFATIASSFLLPLPDSTYDNCSIDSVAYVLSGALTGSGAVPNIPSVFPIGTTTIMYTASDVNGNTSSCSFTVVVNDGEGPAITCPGDVILNVPNGTVDTVLTNLGLASAMDLCGNITDTTYTTDAGLPITGNDVSGTAFPVGTTVIIYTVTDNSGNASTCSFTVTVNEEGITDLIDCPGDITACDDVVNNISPIYLVNQANLASLTYTTTPAGVGTGMGDASGSTFPTGPTVVTYLATDMLGMTDACSFVVNVDNESPVWTGCSGLPLTFTSDPGTCEAMATWDEPTASDNCGLASIDASHSSPALLTVGDHEITYVATDSAGNATSCSFMISILDTEAPVWNVCPPTDIVVTPTGGTNCEAVATWTVPTATDLCSTNITYTSNPNPGDIFPAGETVVIYTATDESNNTSICSFTISVVDAGNPTIIDCPTDIVVDADSGLCAAIVNWTEPTAVDDCSSVGISSTSMPGDTFSIGVTNVVYLAIDALGNDTTCSFTITVVDNTPPIVANCPAADIVTSSDPGMCGANVSWPEPTFTDDCDTSIVITSTYSPGDFFAVGTVTVEYVGTDDSGNTDTCHFDVTVQDMEFPELSCPGNVILSLGGTIIQDPNGIMTSNPMSTTNCDSVVVSFTEPTATDNCPMLMVSHNGPTPGDTLAVGVHTLTYAATDAAGNFVDCSFTIEVVDNNTPLEIMASPDDTVCTGSTITLTVMGGATNATYFWEGPSGWTSTDQNPTLPPFNGNYIVTCTSQSGCETTGNIDIMYFTTPTILVSSNSPLCGGNDLELNLDVDVSTEILWTAPNGDTFTDEDLVISNPSSDYSGTWTVVVTNGICPITETIVVENESLPAVEVNSDCNNALCLGESCMLIGSEFPGLAVTYNWESNPAGCIPAGSDGNIVSVTPATSGDCEVYYWVSLGNCVSEIDTFVLSVSGAPIAVDDTYNVAPGDSLVNFAVISNDTFNTALGYEITLVPPTSTRGTLVLHPDGTMTYTAPEGFVGMDQFVYELCINCETESCVTAVVTINVEDESCLVPNVITPNGDQSNELLIISCLDGGGFPNNSMQIFNQWGDEVYFAKPYTNNWDGTLDGEAGKDLPDGTYYYIFKLDEVSDADKGYITIFR